MALLAFLRLNVTPVYFLSCLMQVYPWQEYQACSAYVTCFAMLYDEANSENTVSVHMH